MESAIILDGNLKSALACVRSLGERGIIVSVGATRDTGMALHSRYATTRFTYPSPYTAQEGFVARLKEEAMRMGGKPVVYALSDATLLSLYVYRDVLQAHMTLVFPETTAMDIAFDKAGTYSLARLSGIPTITTYAPELPGEVARLMETVEYPVVVKTRRSVTWHDGVGRFGTAQFVHEPEALMHTFTTLKQKNGEAPLIQTLVMGEEYGVEMLAHKGKSFATVTHHRMRSLSPTGGASVLKETVDEGDLRSTLEGYAHLLVSKLTWSGPIMVEFKVDSDSRVPYLMEINGRFWGSLPLSVASGVDMPYLYYQYACSGKPPLGVGPARSGIVTRHFCGDVRHLIRVWCTRDAMRPLVYPKRWSAFRNFFSLPQGTKSDVWSFKDPKPALMEIIDIGQRFFHVP